MIRKFATTKAVLDAQMWDDTRRTAHRVSFQYTPRQGYLYVRSRAISSRTNDNFDNFPAEEIKEAYRSFVGKPVFVNHHNSDHRRARGVIIDAALHEDRLADGQEDTWVEVLMEIDADRFPKLAKAILAGEVERTSMGCDVAYSVCSVCNNKASTPLEYCKHIPAMKGQKIRRVTASGAQEDILVYEKCVSEGSLVLTARGEVPIEQVLAGDLVLTRRGWRNVAGSAFMGLKETVVVTLEDGRQITCTADHRIATEDGWVEAAALLPSSRCFTAALPAMTPFSSSTHFDPGVLVGVGVSDRAVGLGGLPVVSSVVFGRDGFQVASLDAEAYPADVVDLQAVDVHAAQAHDGPMHQVLAVGDPIHDAVAVALAGRTLPDEAGAKFGHSQLGEGSGEEPFQLMGVRSVVHGATVPVYDLAVDGEHEFVANGIVVHNCYGLKFFENSVLVEDPADPTAFFLDVDDRGVGGGYHGSLAKAKGTPGIDGGDERRTAALVGSKLATTAARRPPQGVRMTASKLAYGETVAPRQVSTLRDDSCPVCGEVSGFNGERCMTCGYFKPPDQFMDPDLTKAKEVDLRQDQEETAEIDSEGDSDGLFDLSDPQGQEDEVDPEDPADIQGEVTSGPTTPAEEGAQKAVEGEQPPVDLKGQESPAPDPAPGRQVAEDGPELKGTVFELAKPEEEVQEPSQPDPAPAQPEAEDGGDDSASEDDDDQEDDESSPPKKPKPTKKQSTQRNRGESMRPTLKALAEQQIMLDANKKAIKAIAQLAGIDVSSIYVQAERRIAAMQRRADAENPAQPVEEPSAESPSESSADALGNLNDADVTTAGGVTEEDGLSGSTVDVMAVGEVMGEESAATADVTAPTSGAAMKDQDATLEGDVTARGFDPENAFPIEATAAAQNRVFASLRLARLRIQAGIAQGDDLVVSEQIAKSSMTNAAIRQEIATLSAVARTAAAAPARPAPFAREARRAVPSLGATASAGTPGPISGSTPAIEDAFLFD